MTGAHGWLRPGGHVLVETGRTQLDETLTAMREAGLMVAASVDDESGGVVARGTSTSGGA